MEGFREVEYYGALFMVNKDGEVYRDGKKCSVTYDACGYPKVSSGKDKSVFIHRLVAIAFIPNPDNKKEVNHKDFNRKNFNVCNLEWMTHSENIQYSKQHGRYKGKFGEDNPNYGNDTLSKKYKANPELSKEKQSRPRGKNGRAVKISLYDNGEFVVKCDCIVDLHEYMRDKYKIKVISSSAFLKSIGDTIKYNRKYLKRFTFIKH